jgi:hypothetical protein
MIIFHIGLLCILLAFTPLLLARRMAISDGAGSLPVTAGILAVLLTLSAAIGLHILGIPITSATLTITHLTLLAVTLACTLSSFRHSSLNQESSFFRPPLLLVFASGLLLLLLLPYTHFTGIDTYKWQDLATSVRMEKSLPWIVHPLSLFGFTPRAYPPAHPVLLATVQIVGHLGVEGGFAVVSVFTAILGLATSTNLASRLFTPRIAAAAGILYCFSPVFIRYAHWATGRGLFLAIFPAFIAALLPPGAHRHGASRRLATVTILALLLLLTHKVALVAVPLVLLAAISAPLLPRRLPSAARIMVTLPFLAAAAAIVSPALLPGPAGLLPGLLRTSVMRFAWMYPFAIVGLWLPSKPASGTDYPSRAWNMLLMATLPALPLAFEHQMYGALYALPFICIFAAQGLDSIASVLSPRCRQILLTAIAGITLAGAMTTIIVRSQLAATPALYSAAMALEAHDPQGPFMIHAPGIARTRIQAYVSGCARFMVRTGDSARLQWSAPPPRQTSLRAGISAWTSWLRAMFALSDTETSWYGDPCRQYHFVINGQGSAPSDAVLFYDRDNIRIFESPP